MSFALPIAGIVLLFIALCLYIRPTKRDALAKVGKEQAEEVPAKAVRATTRARAATQQCTQKAKTHGRILISLVQVLSSIGPSFLITFPVVFTVAS